jgi:hypothetical protein
MFAGGPASVAAALADAEVEAQRAEAQLPPEDHTPPEGRYSSDWPETYDAAMIAQESMACVKGFLDDWGWELQKYARLNVASRAFRVLRYEIHFEGFDGYGRQEQVLNWYDSEFGQTALWWSAMHGNGELTSRLLDARADVNLADADGWSPLIVAAFYGHADVVRQLIDAGADATLQVADGDTAHDKAAAWDHTECALLLKRPP